MSSEDNLSLVRRYYEDCANDYGEPGKERALRAADELLATDFAMSYNDDGDHERVHGRDSHKEFLLAHTGAFNGERWTIETIVADKQTVACLVRARANVTETGNPIDLRMADFFTVGQGRLTSLHRFLDFRTLDAQMEATVAAQG